MAALTAAQVAVVAVDGATDRVVLAKVLGVTAADTVDVGGAAAILPTGYQFRKVREARLYAPIETNPGVNCTIAGTVLTLPAGPSTDDGWLVITGEAV